MAEEDYYREDPEAVQSVLVAVRGQYPPKSSLKVVESLCYQRWEQGVKMVIAAILLDGVRKLKVVAVLEDNNHIMKITFGRKAVLYPG